ncbi:MAG: DegV family EDD domain-containing protein [Oscillospiraceae bacterium]|nr:DegV family EDD domain-containing protein [Oscillospiraceae bacterium]
MDVRIVADSSCDVFDMEELPLSVVPLKIYSDTEYLDDQSLDVDAMIGQLRKYGGRSHTSCPSVTEWAEAYGKEKDVYVFPITKGLSGSYCSAMAARALCLEENGDRNIKVFDTRSAGPGVLLLMEKLRDLLRRGLDFDSVCGKMAEYRKSTHLLYSLESLHNFAANGRVSKLAAAAAEVLSIRILGTGSEDGKLELLTKSRGRARARRDMLSEVEKRGYRGGKMLIAHCQNQKGAEELKKAITEHLGGPEDLDIRIYPLRGLCSYYAEPGGILLAFEGENPEAA